jgi:hypothetical protein
MSQPSDDFRVPAFPEPIVLDALPPHLRDNPIARLHVQLPSGVERDLVALAAEEDAPIEDVARELTASVR